MFRITSYARPLFFLSKKLSIIGLLGILSACSLFGPSAAPPIHHYLLIDPSITTIPNTSTPLHTKKTLLFNEINTPIWLNTSKMAYQLQPNQFNYFALHQWTAPPPQLLQPIILHALQQANIYSQVINSASPLIADQQLYLQLINFQQQFWQPTSNYQFTIQAELINLKTKQPLGFKRFNITVPSGAATPEAGVNAANNAIAEWLPQLIQFCYSYA